MSKRQPIEHLLLKDRRVRAVFEGKTIERIDGSAVNITTFFFTDGTSIAIEVEALGPAIYGMVACDPCAKVAD